MCACVHACMHMSVRVCMCVCVCVVRITIITIAVVYKMLVSIVTHQEDDLENTAPFNPLEPRSQATSSQLEESLGTSATYIIYIS